MTLDRVDYAFISVAVILAAAGGYNVGCTKQEAKTALDVANATCTAIERQDPNDPYVTLTCSAIDVGTGIAKIFLARVPRQTAAAMMAHCPESKP